MHSLLRSAPPPPLRTPLEDSSPYTEQREAAPPAQQLTATRNRRRRTSYQTTAAGTIREALAGRQPCLPHQDPAADAPTLCWAAAGLSGRTNPPRLPLAPRRTQLSRRCCELQAQPPGEPPGAGAYAAPSARSAPGRPRHVASARPRRRTAPPRTPSPPSRRPLPPRPGPSSTRYMPVAAPLAAVRGTPTSVPPLTAT